MGAGASVDVVTKEQCQALYGDLFSDAEWAKHAVDSVVTRDKLSAVFSELTDVFLTHDWGTDGTTHRNVSAVNTLLKARGITTWFDEEKMEGNVKKQMIHGIDHARAIVVFVTQRYMDKVGGTNAEDNCQLEFNYAARRKTASKMISVLIDPSPALKNTANWTGEVGFVLGGHLYLDLSPAFGNDQLLASKVDELVAKITSVVGTPLAQRMQALQQEVAAPPSVTMGAGGSTPRASSASNTVPLASLTHHQVGTMLNNLTCSKYSAAFVENEITGEALCGVASPDDVKELGVTLVLKARLLFDKLLEFKASGVPVHLLQSEQSTPPSPALPAAAVLAQKTVDVPIAVDELDAPVPTGPAVAPSTFEELKAALVPPSWVQLYQYPLDTSGANRLSDHELTWPTPACTLTELDGLHANGEYADLLTDRDEHHLLEPLGGRFDNHEFVVAWSMKVLRGDVTPICAGLNPWFAIDITADMHLVVQCNQDTTTYVVQLNGNPVVVASDTWLDVAVLMDVPHSVIQVVVDSDWMDKIDLPRDFALERPLASGCSRERNQLRLTRLDSKTKLFHGYLRNIELYSSVPSTRPRPVIQDFTEPDSHAQHMAKVANMTSGLVCLCDYADMTTSVVDRIGASYPELGTYFDGDFYYPEADREWAVAQAGQDFGDKWNYQCFVVTTRASFFVLVSNMYGHVTIHLNRRSASRGFKVRNEIQLYHKSWNDVAVKVDGRQIEVVVNGQTLDPITLDSDIDARPGSHSSLHLVRHEASNACFFGYMASLTLWSTGPPPDKLEEPATT